MLANRGLFSDAGRSLRYGIGDGGGDRVGEWLVHRGEDLVGTAAGSAVARTATPRLPHAVGNFNSPGVIKLRDQVAGVNYIQVVGPNGQQLAFSTSPGCFLESLP